MSIIYKGQTIDTAGKDATINDVNSLTVKAGNNVEITQDGDVLTINATGGGSSGEIYSTEEVRIGTWTDGKPLYRKVVTADLSNPSAIYTAPSHFNIIKFTPISTSSSGSVFTGNIYISDSVYATYRTVNSNTIGALGNGLSDLVKITFIIEYTKTTDSAQTLNLLSSDAVIDISAASRAKKEPTAIKSTE